MPEQTIRDVLLVSLNGQYEWSVTGETFNCQGKTDILIRAEGKISSLPNANSGKVQRPCLSYSPASRVSVVEGYKGSFAYIQQKQEIL